MANRMGLRAILRQKQQGRCCYCQVRMILPSALPKKGKPPADTETLEHLRRRIDGGTNCRDNMALACFRCNSERGAMDWLIYASYRRGELWEVA